MKIAGLVLNYFCLAVTSLSLIGLSSPTTAQSGAPGGDWPYMAGDMGHSKYSPLDQIDRQNVKDLEVAWRWTSIDAGIQAANPDDRMLTTSTYFQCTPLMIDGVLFGSTCLGQAFAVDPVTGETLWEYNPEAYKAGRPPNLGFISRGVGYWADGADKRIFYSGGDSYLYALNAETGEPVEAFGDTGRADLTTDVRGAIHGPGYGHPSAPMIVNNVVIVGSSISDGPLVKEGVPGVVKGFDAKTGTLLWTFNVVPKDGEYGTETWEDGSWAYSGGANVWTNIAADPELGYVYLPTSTPTNDFYGGHRLGDNLFAESLVCLDARTGKRVWHFQMVHHGLWDYDTPCAPNLVDITVDGKRIKAIAQATKQGFVYVFDRATGEPVWPIEERPVAQSTVPGERAAPTQPFPTKPPPFAMQGVTGETIIDFTPEIRAKAMEVLENYQIGPLFTPPLVGKPTVILPGYGGGVNWPGCAFDPETGMLYVPTMNRPSVLMLAKPDPARSNFRYTRSRGEIPLVDGLPIVKAPYAEIVAIDLNRGEIAWRETNGGEGARDHPLLKGLDVPPLGSNSRAGALVTKTLLFATEGSGRSGSANQGSTVLRALDKATGEVLASFDLGDQPTGVPMTYMADGKQYVVVAVGSTPAQLVGFALP